jgi:exopolyphosphatase/pppGpp-phosphohydrolase
MQADFTSTSAAIDIGSNTIHIVVARCAPKTLDILADEVELVRIGESVTATGAISQEKRDAALATLRTYKALAEKHNATPIFVVATEAIRQARNSSDFIEAIHRELGLEVQLIEGTIEATLTFLGATYERSKEAHALAPGGRNTSVPTGAVMDLGGGSTEIITAKQEHITWRTSIPVGSGWLHDRYLSSDPPIRDELYTAYTFLTTYFEGMQIKHMPSSLIVTGGSANSLLALARTAFQFADDEQRLTREDIVRCEGLLHALSAEEIAHRYQQPVGRARILPAGALIIRAMMTRLHLHEIFVSPHGIREGVLLAYARYGEQWLQQVDAPNRDHDAHPHAKENTRHETFAHSGRRLLLDRTEKLLEWRGSVLKHNDVEAVHKMRVASRRLRATLDAYEAICVPQPFKEVYKETKKIADILGNARDTDVMIQNLQGQMQQASAEEQVGTQWLIDRLQEYREQHQRVLETFFKKFDEHTFKQKIEACLS